VTGLSFAAGGRVLLPPAGHCVLECRRCGARVVTGCADGQIAQHLRRLADFRVEKVEVVFRGICRDCRKRGPE
jgi:Fe2+ or Zn2+ uptake regulation protein